MFYMCIIVVLILKNKPMIKNYFKHSLGITPPPPRFHLNY
jgi:hypothetical protein